MSPSEYQWNYLAVFVGAAGALAMVAFLLFLSFLLAPKQRSEPKGYVYECGMLPIGQNWSQVHVRYYLFAILFMIFDVEAVFLFPWAVILAQVGAVAFYEMLIFIAILLFGLVYAWRKGILEWR